MARVKRGTISRKKHKKLLESTKGFTGLNKKLVRRARETYLKAKAYEYRDRRTKKRDFRQLWITRISAGLTDSPLSYSQFMNKLKQAHIALNRKTLSNLAVTDKDAFDKIIQKVK